MAIPEHKCDPEVGELTNWSGGISDTSSGCDWSPVELSWILTFDISACFVMTVEKENRNLQRKCTIEGKT